MNLATYPTRKFERNILACYARTTDADIVSGSAWYANAHSVCYDLAVRHSKTVEQVAGIVAAFSPMIGWKQNLETAAHALETNIYSGSFRANNRKARAIANGKAPELVLGGDKVRAFYSCILSAGEASEVCIDRHALAIALGRDATEQERHNVTHKRYRTFASAYTKAAIGLRLRACNLQAICWICWRREKGIVE